MSTWIRNLFNSDQRSKRVISAVLFICLFVVAAIALIPQSVFAQGILGDVLGGVLNGFLFGIAWLIYFVAWLGGQLLLGLTVILVWVASYNGFIDEKIVTVGWTIVRDLCNMAFIIALLYMAFNMVFGLKKGGNSLLTLIINAGLINFSKVISGFVIDIAQVIMLTFVHGFYKIAGGNILEGLGFTKMFESVGFGSSVGSNVIPTGSNQATIGLIMITILVALIMIYIAVGIILTFIIVLIGRIFKLWSLLITSPIPFVRKILPGIPDFGSGGNYWSDLAKTASAGPILAFWLWLVFTAVRLYQGQFSNNIFGTPPTGPTSITQGGTLTGQAAGFSQAGSIQQILGFMVFIGMLMLALQQAQSQANAMGNGVGDIAKKVRGKAHKWTKDGAKWVGKGAADLRVFGKKDAETGQRTSAMDLVRRGKHAWDLAVDRSPRFRELLTKEGRKTKESRRQSEAKATVHAAHAKYILKKPELAQRLKSGLTTRNLFSQANDQVKKLKDAGALEQQSDAEIAFQEALDGKDMARAIGVARHMAEQGWGVPAQMMQRIMQTFKAIQPKGELHKQLVNDLGKKASSAKNANSYRAKSADPVTEDPLTGELSWADPSARAKAADTAIMEEADFEKLDQEFVRDKRLIDASGIENDGDELYVRLANLASWGKTTKAHAKDFENPEFARHWLSRRGSEELRKQKADKIDQLIGLASKKGVKLSAEQLASVELIQRLYRTPDAHMTRQYTTGTGSNKRIRTDYNIASILQSVGNDRDLDVTQYDRNTFEMVKGTDQKVKTKTAAIVDVAITAEDLTVAGAVTDSVRQNTDKFFQTVLDNERKLQKSASDKPFDTNEARYDQILAENAKLNAANRARLQYAQSVVQRLKSELTSEDERSQVELMEMQRSLNEAEAEVRSLFSDTTLTDVLDNAGSRKNQLQVYEDSHLKMRLKNTSELLRKKFEETNKKVVKDVAVGVGSDMSSNTAEGEAAATGFTADNISRTGDHARTSFAYAIGNGKSSEEAFASAESGSKTFIKLIQEGYEADPAVDPAAALATRTYANLAPQVYHKYSDAVAKGEFNDQAAADVLIKAVHDAGFTIGTPNFDRDIKNYYNTQAAYYEGLGIHSEAEKDRLAYNDTVGYVFSYTTIPALGGGALRFGEIMKEAGKDYNNALIGRAKVDAQRANDIANAGVDQYNTTIASGGNAVAAAGDADVAMLGFGGGGFISSSAATTQAGIIDNRLNIERSVLDEKIRSTADKNLGGADVQMNRAGGRRMRTSSLLPKPLRETDASKEKEHLDNRKVLAAHTLINRALSMLEDAKRTQSQVERATLLSNARKIFFTAKQPLLDKHYKNTSFEAEFTNAEGALATYTDFSAPTSRNEAAIDEMRNTMSRIFNNYVK